MKRSSEESVRSISRKLTLLDTRCNVGTVEFAVYNGRDLRDRR